MRCRTPSFGFSTQIVSCGSERDGSGVSFAVACHLERESPRTSRATVLNVKLQDRLVLWGTIRLRDLGVLERRPLVRCDALAAQRTSVAPSAWSRVGSGEGCDPADGAPAASLATGSAEPDRALRGLPGSGIVCSAPGRREVVPARCRARHAPMEARVPRALERPHLRPQLRLIGRGRGRGRGCGKGECPAVNRRAPSAGRAPPPTLRTPGLYTIPVNSTTSQSRSDWFSNARFMVTPISAGVAATAMPAASSAAILSAAVPLPPEMIAPA